MDVHTELNPGPRVQSFQPELNCVELQYALKIVAGEPRPQNKHFFRADVLPAIGQEISVPIGPKYAQALMQPQILQCLISFRAAEPGVMPPWTGEIVFRFDESCRRLTVVGDIKSAYPEPEEIKRLSDYCHALANMLVAYAQIPETPDFAVTFKANGFWDEPR